VKKTAILLTEKPSKDLNFFWLSVSKLKTFESCKAKYLFSYVKKLPKKQWDYHVFGKFLHKVLEDFHNEKMNGCTDSNGVIMKRAFDSAREEYKDLTEEQLKESHEILIQYLKKIKAQQILEKLPEIVSNEAPFDISIDNKILLNGFIDRIQIDPDGVLHVADYKTSNLFDKDENKQIIVVSDITKTKKYKNYKRDIFQLKTYAYVMFLKYPELEKVRCSYILLRHNFHEIIVEFTRDEAMEMEKVFQDAFAEISNEKLFRPVVTPLCEYCDFLESCESGKEYMERRNPKFVPKFGETSW
jgi:CRISPR/Cas system-associated exonuclease Cas4 (RecB family)